MRERREDKEATGLNKLKLKGDIKEMYTKTRDDV